MTSTEFCTLTRHLMQQPAAPYHEHDVRDEAERLCRRHGLDCHRDDAGNLLLRLHSAPSVRPLVLAAHLDHPGFEIVRRLAPKRWLVRFLGGVPDDYFRRGLRIRLMPGATKATLAGKVPGERRFEVRAASPPAQPPQFAVWDLEEFALRRGRIVGRACDDLIGVAAVLATLIELKRRCARVNVIGVLSRAEEVGFGGALALAGSRRLPSDALVVSLETSREMPPVTMGRGVILRVGDKSSIFDSAATRFLQEIATGLQAKRPGFRFQRALMSGGTCEATAYQEFGYQTAAVCIALGNYHNCGPRHRVAEEFVSVADAGDLVNLLVATARWMLQYPRLVARLSRRLRRLRRTTGRKLPASA